MPFIWEEDEEMELKISDDTSVISDYDVLEQFFYCLELDYKKLPSLLLNYFGDMVGIFKAEREVLIQLGLDEETIEVLNELIDCARTYLKYKLFDNSYSDLHQLSRDLAALFRSVKDEGLYVCEITDGRVSSMPVQVDGGESNIVTTALMSLLNEADRFNAEKFLLIHNHPYGSCLPSDDDYTSTNMLINALTETKSSLVEHIIFGDDGQYLLLRHDYIPFDGHPITHMNANRLKRYISSDCNKSLKASPKRFVRKIIMPEPKEVFSEEEQDIKSISENRVKVLWEDM